ncbi:cytochrome b [Stappia taiwanensis]|uniref:Cytochrome b n=1 Tax=Stappia taiwanensis TaxID=992267 RepID=A0A838XHW4_9HYPH|nr:cytochrome b [Stappia taiwanensis]MBA4610175.1 cytochrome b [Stappia taiwanensis]GGE77430.1 cytochrome b [Stappia taiwanensis]
MQLRNTQTGYGTVAIAFHWTMAVLVAGLFILGKYMSGLEPTDPQTFALYQWHKSFGFVVLALAGLRLVWKAVNPAPKLPEGTPLLLRLAAALGHAGLYAVLLALPLSGWLMVSSSPWGIPTVLFNTLPVPHLPVPAELGTLAQAEATLKQVHEALGLFLLLLLAVHVAAALKHHFYDRDTVLTRMLSTRPARQDAETAE